MKHFADRYCRACGEQLEQMRVPRPGFSEYNGRPNYDRWDACPNYRQERKGMFHLMKNNGHDALLFGTFWTLMSDMDYALWMSLR